MLAVLYTRMLARGAAAGNGSTGEEPSPLVELHGELMSLIVLPYLGGKVAGNELRKQAPPALEQGDRSPTTLATSLAIPAPGRSLDLSHGAGADDDRRSPGWQ